MEKQKDIKITIEWTDKNNERHKVIYENEDIENAEIHIGLMTGNICEEDLKP